MAVSGAQQPSTAQPSPTAQPLPVGPTAHRLPAGQQPTTAQQRPVRPEPPTSPAQALLELQAGNRRFVAGTSLHPNQDAGRRAVVADGQHPFAVVLGCSDSRLAAEIIFDRGLGDLFVVRTAGHTIGAEVLGSVEYAVTVLDAPLVVVLGHDSCGAVQAAREADQTGEMPSGYLGAVVGAVVPSVRRAARKGVHDVDQIVDIHIDQTVEVLLDRSVTLTRAVQQGRCAVVGMSYRLAAGEVRVVRAEPFGNDVALAAGPTGAAPS